MRRVVVELCETIDPSLWHKYEKSWYSVCRRPLNKCNVVIFLLCAKYSVYIVVEPSRKSMFIQVADLGINRFIKSVYGRMYTSSLCLFRANGRGFDDLELAGCVVRSLNSLKKNADLILTAL